MDLRGGEGRAGGCRARVSIASFFLFFFFQVNEIFLGPQLCQVF